ncbi:MAG: SDR family oxidoreductase [Pseudomonadota bacterium]
MNNTVAVTGGATGIGAATITRLRDKGFDVINLDIADSDQHDVHNIHCDLSNPYSITDAVGELPDTLHSLVNVAGVAQGIIPDESVVMINFLGMRHLTESALSRIENGGNIVIVASSAGRDWQTRADLVTDMLNTPHFTQGREWLYQHHNEWHAQSYKFSKQCAAAYTYRAAGLARNRGVRANCVNPGIVETQLSPQFREMVGDERYDWIVSQTGRAGTPADIAQVVEFLAVGDCQWLNGVEITVDGGYFAGTLGGWVDLAAMPVT